MANSKKQERKIFEKLPFEIVENEENSSDVFVGPKKFVLPSTYKINGLDLHNFEARVDDIYVTGFMRSGTTLICEMVWLIENDLNYKEAAKHFLDYRFPHLGYFLNNREMYKEIYSNKDSSAEAKDIALKYLETCLENLIQKKNRRFIKTHLPLSIMPQHIFEVGAKVIYCARHPGDVLVSLYCSSEFFKYRPESINSYFNLLKNNLARNGPYFEHVKEGWERRSDKNFLFLFYEDIIKSKRQTITKVADFLGKNLTEDQIDCLEDHLSLEKFKNNKSVNCDHLIKVGVADGNGSFIGQGKSGRWRKFFDENLTIEFNQWVEGNLNGTDLKFPEE